MTTPLSQFQQIQAARARAQSSQAIANQQWSFLQNLDAQGQFKTKLENSKRDAQAFIDKEQAEFTAEKDAIQNLLKAIDVTENAKKPLDRYKQSLQEKKRKYDKENKDLEQRIRANRRRFLDNDPQSGVLPIFGQRTNDNKVMLGFWFALLLFVNTVLFTTLSYMEKQHIPAIYAGVNAGVIIVVLLLLFYYG